MLSNDPAAAAIDWGSVPDWVVAITAIVGVAFGLFQLRALRRSEELQVQIARATLLREFDRDYESPEILASRQKILQVRNRFEDEVGRIRPALTDEQQIAEVARRCANYTTDIWEKSRTFDGDPTAAKDSSADEYALLMRLPSWCETVGHMCRRNLMPMADLLDLYDQLIVMTIGNIRQHINLRAERPPHKNSRYLENAVWLYEQAAEHKRKREAPVPTVPHRAPTRWDR